MTDMPHDVSLNPPGMIRTTPFSPARLFQIRVAIILIVASNLLSGAFLASASSALNIRKLAGGGAQVSWQLSAEQLLQGGIYQLQRSSNLSNWENLVDIDLRPSSIPLDTNEFIDLDPGPIRFYRLVRGQTVLASAATGSELYGFSEQFQRSLGELGQISVQEFKTRYGKSDQYLDGVSYDPSDAGFWDSMEVPAGNPDPNNPTADPNDLRQNNWGLNEEETALFKKQGFVVSGRMGDHSFVDTYYKIFTDDLPVFVTLDSVLHAWNRNFITMLSEFEEVVLVSEFRTILSEMRDQLPVLAESTSEALIPSLHDADLYLSVALSLLADETIESILGQSNADVHQMLALVKGEALTEVSLFGRTGPELVDFSQFRPRGHYTRSPLLSSYFKAAMWTGRVDLRVAGPAKFSSPRELGTAIILHDAMSSAQQLESYRNFDEIIQTFVGLSDSMTVTQLTTVMEAAGIGALSEVTSLEKLEAIQRRIEAGTLGTQAIASHGYFTSSGGPKFRLPRSFTLFGQRFVMDSWAMGKVVFDQILWNNEKVNRRLPSGVDVAFSVFGNSAASDILADRIQNGSGVPFRDGYPIQHHLGALHDLFSALPESLWQDNIYTGWLYTLRQWAQPLDESVPEVFRTREWAYKNLASQLASWTQLRHGTVLYAKQSATFPVLCSFPYSYVEPNQLAWEALASMAENTAARMENLSLSGSALVFGGPFGPELVSKHDIVSKQRAAMTRFKETCLKLAAIVEKQNAGEALTSTQTNYLKNMVEIMTDYVGQRSYSGWYPQLFYQRSEIQEPHSSELWDPVVTDVHTDFPDASDPGTILHEGVGNTAMMVVSVDCEGRRIYAGPVFTYYEFTSGPGVFERMTDEEWKAKLIAHEEPAEPEWTAGHRVSGSIRIPHSVR